LFQSDEQGERISNTGSSTMLFAPFCQIFFFVKISLVVIYFPIVCWKNGTFFFLYVCCVFLFRCSLFIRTEQTNKLTNVRYFLRSFGEKARKKYTPTMGALARLLAVKEYNRFPSTTDGCEKRVSD
jgi:hypothetical protein